MANITLSVPDAIRMQMDEHSEIKWSEVAKNAISAKVIELRKLSILKKYVDKEPIPDEDWAWMDEHDWHPVDELPMKKEYVKSLKASMKEKSYPFSLSEQKK